MPYIIHNISNIPIYIMLGVVCRLSSIMHNMPYHCDPSLEAPRDLRAPPSGSRGRQQAAEGEALKVGDEEAVLFS